MLFWGFEGGMEICAPFFFFWSLFLCIFCLPGEDIVTPVSL